MSEMHEFESLFYQIRNSTEPKKSNEVKDLTNFLRYNTVKKDLTDAKCLCKVSKYQLDSVDIAFLSKASADRGYHSDIIPMRPSFQKQSSSIRSRIQESVIHKTNPEELVKGWKKLISCLSKKMTTIRRHG